MKFIYSLMFITFLMTTFTSDVGWGAASNPETEKCIAGIESRMQNMTGLTTVQRQTIMQAEIKKCIANSGVLVRNDSKGVIAYNPGNKSFQTCKTQMGTDKINSTAFSKCVSDLEAKNKAPVKTPAAPKAVSETQAVKQSSESSSNTSSRKCDGETPGDCICSGSRKITVKDASMNSSATFKCEDTAKTPIPPKFEVDQCLSGIKYYIDSCTDSSEKAIASCNPEEQAESGSDSAFDMKNIFNAANNLALKKGAGSGAYETCLQTALITQAGFYTTEELKKTCEPEVAKCKSDCEAAKNALIENQDSIYINCKNQAMAADPGLSESEFETEYGNGIANQLKDLIGQANQSAQACEKDAADYKAQIEQASNDFNNAAKQAQVCRCQTGSTGEDCSAIQGPAQCVLNPSAPGCALSTVNCNNSNSVQCQCLRNPNLAVCKTGNSKVSALAGQPFSTPSSSIGSGVAPKMNNGDFDISFADEALNAGASGTTGSATSPFGSAEASGGGGGVGSGAGSGTGEGDPAAAADGEGGLKHLLDKAKGFVGNSFGKIFGDKNPTDKKYKTDANGKKIDPSKWKPGMIRGVAGNGSEIGPKHRDIWKAMNSQYFLQEKTFIDGK